MKRVLGVLVCLGILGGLHAYFPLYYHGDAVRSPLMSFESELIRLFGTYHDEMYCMMEAQRINDLDDNHSPLTRMRYSDIGDDNWGFVRGRSYQYDDAGRLASLHRIDEDGAFMNIEREYLLYNDDGSRMGRINMDWNEDGELRKFYNYLYDYSTGELEFVHVAYYD